MKRSASVTIAAVFEMLFGAFFLLLGIGLLAANMALQKHPEQMHQPVSMGMMLMIVAVYGSLGALGIGAGIGLFQLRNWARIMSLIAGGIFAIGGTLCGVLMLVVPLPAIQPGQPGAEIPLRGIMAAVFLVPALIGLWWLVLFTRPRIVELFRSASLGLVESQRPLSITLIGGFYIFSGLLGPLSHLYQRTPALLFGKIIVGTPGLAINLLWSLVYLILGIGLLKLDRRAWIGSMALLAFGLINGAMTWMLPGRAERIQRMMSSASYSQDATAMAWIFSPWFMIIVIVISLGLPGYFLLTRRAAFDRAALPPALS